MISHHFLLCLSLGRRGITGLFSRVAAWHRRAVFKGTATIIFTTIASTTTTRTTTTTTTSTTINTINIIAATTIVSTDISPQTLETKSNEISGCLKNFNVLPSLPILLHVL